MDLSTVDFPVVLTSVIALITSLGGAGVLIARGKFVGAIGQIAEVMVDFAALLTLIVDASKDDNSSKEEWDSIKNKAFEIKGHCEALLALFGK